MLAQVIRAALLDSRAFREIGEEPEYMFRALLVVFISAASFWIGIRNLPLEEAAASRTLVMLAAISTVMAGWILWASVAYLIGTRLMGGQANQRILLRSLGIAYGPGILVAFITVPFVGGLFLILSLFWLLATGTIAIRESQGVSTIRALLPSVVGWLLALWVLPSILFRPV